MSLLTICQNVADAVPIARPASIVGSSDDTARLLLTLANQAGKALQKRHAWVLLQKEHTFSTVASQADYAMPSDFDRLLDRTVWDRANYRAIRGPLSAGQWQYQKSSLATQPGITKRYRVRASSGAKVFSIDPTPSSVESCVFEYVSANWCQSSGGSGQSSFQQDADTGIVSEYLLELGLLWRTLKRLGFDYLDEKDEYERQLGLAIAQDGGAPEVALTSSVESVLIGSANVPDTGYGGV